MKAITLLDLTMTEKWTLLGGAVLLLIPSLIKMSIPIAIAQTIDMISKADGISEAHQNINWICFTILTVGLAHSLCTFTRNYLIEVAGDRITNKMRFEVFSAILRQEIGFFDQNQTGELLNRLSSDTSQLSHCCTGNVASGLKALFQALVGVFIMINQSPSLSRIGITIVPAFAFMSIVAGQYLKKLRAELQDELAYCTQFAEERLTNIRTVRAFCQEPLEAKKYQDKLNVVLKVKGREAWANSIFKGLAGLSHAVVVVAVLYFGRDMVTDHSITVGTLSAFMLYVVYVGNSIQDMGNCYTQFLKGQGASTRLWELINRTPNVSLTGGDTPTDTLAGNIRFHNVSFFYPTRPDFQVLDNVTLDVPAGSILAIVGPSGTGKSSLVSLLLRFYDPTSGVIKLDGTDISRLNPEWLRNQIGVVTQEPILFSGSIKDNILYGIANPEEVKDNRLYTAAEESNAYEFIRRFPDQYDTFVGERGLMLSAIAIARALISSPKILIFDEATSSLDAENERLVQEALERVATNRTVIIIAHRLSTIRNANKIAVVADGKFAELGTFEDLMTIPYGKFRKLVERQTIDKPKF